jgi:amidase
MALDVASAAMLLSAMEGADPKDPVTMRSTKHHGRDYTREFLPDGLRGLRVGVIRSQEFHMDSAGLFDQAIADLGDAGAVIVEGLVFPEWPKGFWDDSLNVLQYEFKHDLNKYFATLPGDLGAFSLEKLIAYNQDHADTEMPWFGQDLLEASQDKGGLDSAEYKKALMAVQNFTRSSIDGLLQAYNVDVLIMRSNAPAFMIDLVYGDNYQGGSSTMAAVAGYPHITVPMGRWGGLPVGLSFVGTAFSEPVLIRAAYAFEQATKHALSLAGKNPWHIEP